SGSGKSTLLQLTAGLMRPDSGEVRVGDTAMHTLNEPEVTRARRDRIGFVYQQFCLLPTLTLVENVALPLELQGEARAPALTTAQARLTDLGIGTLAARFPDQVSGGEQQRAGIARALVCNPDVVLADEPTGSLDVQSAEQVLDAVFAIARGEARCVVVATHSAAVAARADRVVTVHDGHLIEGLPAGQTAW
ncbi:MAG: ATP-binding cassette domain-containing protein, partial [Pseudomonadota bacterium]